MDLIAEVARRRFADIIAQDRNQLGNPAERQAYIDNRLHWIGHGMPGVGGLALIAAIAAAYLAAFPLNFATISTALRTAEPP